MDPLTLNPPVASLNEAGLASYYPGVFYTGLTRDDEAGLRYLLSTNNVIFETPTPGSVLVSSTSTGGINYGPPFVLYTSNYTAFAEAALTNDPVTLSNLYPGLIITSSTPHFAYLPTTTYVAYYTNYIGAPAGSQTLVVAPVTTYSVVTTYSNTYANVIITSTNSSSVGLLYTVTVGPVSRPLRLTLRYERSTSYRYQSTKCADRRLLHQHQRLRHQHDFKHAGIHSGVYHQCDLFGHQCFGAVRFGIHRHRVHHPYLHRGGADLRQLLRRRDDDQMRPDYIRESAICSL